MALPRAPARYASAGSALHRQNQLCQRIGKGSLKPCPPNKKPFGFIPNGFCFSGCLNAGGMLGQPETVFAFLRLACKPCTCVKIKMGCADGVGNWAAVGFATLLRYAGCCKKSGVDARLFGLLECVRLMHAYVFAEELFAELFQRAVLFELFHCAVDFGEGGFVAFVNYQACAQFFGGGGAPYGF